MMLPKKLTASDTRANQAPSNHDPCADHEENKTTERWVLIPNCNPGITPGPAHVALDAQDVLEIVFSFNEPRQFFGCRRVNRRWNEILTRMVERDYPTQDMLCNDPSIMPVCRGQVRKGREAAVAANRASIMSITDEIRGRLVGDGSSEAMHSDSLELRTKVEETFLRRRPMELADDFQSSYLPSCDMDAFHMYERKRLGTREPRLIVEAMQPEDYFLEIGQMRISPVLEALVGNGRIHLDTGRLDISLAPMGHQNKFFDGPNGRESWIDMPATCPPCQSLFIHQSNEHGGLEFLEEIRGDAANGVTIGLLSERLRELAPALRNSWLEYMRVKMFRLRTGLEPSILDLAYSICKSRVWGEQERLRDRNVRDCTGATVYTMPAEPTFHILLHRATAPHDPCAYGEMSCGTIQKVWTGDDVLWHEELEWNREHCACTQNREPELMLPRS